MLFKDKSRSFWVFSILLMMSMLLHVHDVNATTYVTFNDGRLYVFPDTCLQMMAEVDGRITLVARDGTVYSYPMDAITSIDEQLSKELPTFSSFKFTNKYPNFAAMEV